MTASGLPRVLLVDDEPNVLAALRRHLRTEFEVETAGGGAEALALLDGQDPLAVVVSDYQMPGMNGAAFLAAARRAAPDTTRLLLTGQADLEGAAAAINEGQVFRFLLKPTGRDELKVALRDAIEHRRLVLAERELLERTLHGSVKALTEVLALASPGTFARTTRLRRVVSGLLDAAGVAERWHIDLAAMLSYLGSVSLPPQVARKVDAGLDLTAAEQDMIDALPEVAEQILSSIPRMEPVREAIRYSRKGYDGSGPPDDGIEGEQVPLGGRVLRLANDFTDLTTAGMAETPALTALNSAAGRYDPYLLKCLALVVAEAHAAKIRNVTVAELEPGMVLTADVRTRSGVLLVPRGQEVSPSLLARVRNFATIGGGVVEPIPVLTALT
jgi:response regulator RpfG family c-di-GMP phosphodiesterase